MELSWLIHCWRKNVLTGMYLNRIEPFGQFIYIAAKIVVKSLNNSKENTREFLIKVLSLFLSNRCMESIFMQLNLKAGYCLYPLLQEIQ